MTGWERLPRAAASIFAGGLAVRLLPLGSPACCLGLAAAAWALRTAPARCLALAALGALPAWLLEQPLVDGRFPDPARPVEAVVRASGPPVSAGFGTTIAIRFEILRQGSRIEKWRGSGFLSLPAGPPAGHRYRVTGYLSRAPGVANDGARQRGPWRLRVKSLRLLEPLPGGWRAAWRAVSLDLRQRVERNLGLGSRAESRGSRLARALLLGEASALPDAVQRNLRRFGLAHLVAVSGLHLALLVGAATWAGGLLPRGSRWCLPALMALAYLLLVGPRPSLLRASAMSLLAAVALASGRPASPLHALGWIGALLCVLDPTALGDLGVQLTLAATAGILLARPLFASRWRWPVPESRLGTALAASLGAQIATWPWALPAFHLLSPSAILLNLAAIPWAGVSLLVSAAWLLSSVWIPGAAGFPAAALELLAGPLWWTAELPARFASAVPVGVGRVGGFFLSASTIAVLRWPRVGLAGVAVWGLLLLALRTEPVIELRLLDVGQGEAILMTGGGVAVLVDGGGWVQGDPALHLLLPALARAGIRRLDAIVLTHPDLDHCGGLAGLVDYVPVAELWMSPGWPPRGCVGDLLLAAGPRWRPLWAGERRQIGPWDLHVLHPSPGQRGGANGRSLVLAAEAGRLRVLLTGDIGADAELGLIESSAPRLRSKVLKLAHHGSRTSTTAEFLRAVSPRLAVASAGVGNRYGHPSEIVRARLRGRSIPLLSTDRVGQIRLRAYPAHE